MVAADDMRRPRPSNPAASKLRARNAAQTDDSDMSIGLQTLIGPTMDFPSFLHGSICGFAFGFLLKTTYHGTLIYQPFERPFTD